MEFWEGFEPVSPTGQYFNSSVLSISIISVLETEVPINDTQAMSLLKGSVPSHQPTLFLHHGALFLSFFITFAILYIYMVN